MSSPPLPPQQNKTTMSSNIPLPSTYVSRTESECQLAIDVAAAEKRDERMFYRLINGIQDRHRQMKKKAEVSTSLRSSPRTTTRHTEHEKLVVDRIECSYPALALTNLVGTPRTEMTHDGCLTTLRHDHPVQDDNHDESPSALQSFILPTTTCKKVSDSTSSDNDWSMTGYDDELAVSDRAECRRDKEEEEDGDEEMFILDL